MTEWTKSCRGGKEKETWRREWWEEEASEGAHYTWGRREGKSEPRTRAPHSLLRDERVRIKQLISWAHHTDIFLRVNFSLTSIWIEFEWIEFWLNLKIYNLYCLRYSVFSNTNEQGLTPLHLAAKFGRVDIVKWLTINDVNLNRETPQGYSPIHLAAMNGHVNCLMVRAGAPV